VVSLGSPANNAVFISPANININAAASDSDGTVVKVDFFQGMTLLASDSSSPFTFNWAGVLPGTYSLTAKATDNSGAVSVSSVVNVTVPAPLNIAPSASFISPANNASFTAPASVTIAATATDTDGSIAKVEFFQGTTLLGTSTASPYAFSWTGVPPGTYRLTAKATDDSGATTTSTGVIVTVNPPPNVPPTVGLTSPVNNATFTSPANIAMSAAAFDTDGTIIKVDFFGGTTLLGTVATSPYTLTWSAVPTGTYNLTAKATDNLGAVTTSSPITLIVNPPPNVAPSVSMVTPSIGASFTAPASIAITVSGTIGM
jgi:hypothetical protein